MAVCKERVIACRDMLTRMQTFASSLQGSLALERRRVKRSLILGKNQRSDLAVISQTSSELSLPRISASDAVISRAKLRPNPDSQVLRLENAELMQTIE